MQARGERDAFAKCEHDVAVERECGNLGDERDGGGGFGGAAAAVVFAVDVDTVARSSAAGVGEARGDDVVGAVGGG